MGRLNKQISEVQTIVNKANAKQDFTHDIINDFEGRYIVSHKSILTTNNPSLCFNLNELVSTSLDTEKYDSIGGWLDTDTDLYHLDANVHYKYLETAVLAGKLMKQKAIYDTVENKIITIKY